MAKLAATVYITDPDSHQTVALEAGSEPEPRLAALVPNPAAWEDNKPPTAATTNTTPSPSGFEKDTGDEDKPAVKKTATSPARGRKAAAEGTSGQ